MQIRLFIFQFILPFSSQKWPFSSQKLDFSSANSRFTVQNDGMYLPGITRETCINKRRLLKWFHDSGYLFIFVQMFSSFKISHGSWLHELCDCKLQEKSGCEKLHTFACFQNKKKNKTLVPFLVGRG